VIGTDSLARVASTSGGSAEPGGHGNLLAFAIVVLVAVSAALSVVVNFRVAAYALASLLAMVAVARVLLPVRLVGPLAVRSRAVDAVTCAAMAAALVVLAEGVPL
jgi:Protein of unknown function (DUF3017)